MKRCHSLILSTLFLLVIIERKYLVSNMIMGNVQYFINYMYFKEETPNKISIPKEYTETQKKKYISMEYTKTQNKNSTPMEYTETQNKNSTPMEYEETQNKNSTPMEYTETQNKKSIHMEYTEELNESSISIEYADCRTLLLQYWNISLDETLMISLTQSCFQMDHASIESIFDIQLLQEAVGNTSCPKTNPKFLNKSGPLVALASFPGSGNTWVRVLLESITGIHTGSLYKDNMSNLEGSKRCPTKAGVFIAKTHKSHDRVTRAGCPQDIKFSKAIFILRNPYDALMAEFNRKKGGKVRFASRKDFTSNSWKKFVNDETGRWGNMALYWMTLYDRPVHVLFYERLKANTMFEMYKVMNFLNRNVTLQNLYCLVHTQSDTYYRAIKPEWLTKTNLFDNTMKKRINAKISSVYSNVLKTPKNTDNFKSYILKTNITTDIPENEFAL